MRATKQFSSPGPFVGATSGGIGGTSTPPNVAVWKTPSRLEGFDTFQFDAVGGYPEMRVGNAASQASYIVLNSASGAGNGIGFKKAGILRWTFSYDSFDADQPLLFRAWDPSGANPETVLLLPNTPNAPVVVGSSSRRIRNPKLGGNVRSRVTADINGDLFPEEGSYATLYRLGAATQTVAAGAEDKVSVFDSIHPENNSSASVANHNIKLGRDGVFQVVFTCSYSVNNVPTRIDFSVYKNNVFVSNNILTHDRTVSGEVNSYSFTVPFGGHPNDLIDVRVKHSNAVPVSLTFLSAQLLVENID